MTTYPQSSTSRLKPQTTPHHPGAFADTAHDCEVPEIDLLSPLQLRSLTIRNRIAMSPMCQYCATDGMPNDWHLVHLGSRAVGGAGLVMVEATAVTPQGRISPGDTGIWSDQHVEPFARITRFIESQGAVPGIQLAHAGRKASCDVPWRGGAHLTTQQGRWPTIAPSPIPFNDTDPTPTELDGPGIQDIFSAFEYATRRAVSAGFKVIELHSAHGYLLHQFLSPLCNKRTDRFGGSLENRMRLPLDLVDRIRALVPQNLPLFVRISATDWVDGGWDIEQSVIFCRELKKRGVELIDVSSGGATPKASIPVGRNFQVPLASRIREDSDIMTGAVGLITEFQQADDIITAGDADLVFLGREILRDPYWAINAQHKLEQEPAWPIQYGYAVKRRTK